MGDGDGHVLGCHPVLVVGPPEQAAQNILLLADGYEEDQLDTFQSDCERLRDAIKASAWFNAVPKLHMYRVDVASQTTGADIPASCNNNTKVTANTYFDAHYGEAGLCRMVGGDDELVDKVHKDQVAGGGLPVACNALIVLVNSKKLGASCGADIMWVSARHKDFVKIVLHELGHKAGLADEYDYLVGCGKDLTQDTGFAGVKARNVTKKGNSPPWAVNAALPTTKNDDCTKCDRSPSPVGEGEIGTFEGAFHYHCGYFRPAYNCRMRTSKYEFCSVCDNSLQEWLLV